MFLGTYSSLFQLAMVARWGVALPRIIQSHLPLSYPNWICWWDSHLSISLGRTYLGSPEQDDHNHTDVETQPVLCERRQNLLYTPSWFIYVQPEFP